MSAGSIALRERLRPLQPFLDDPRVEDIAINRPNEAFVLYSDGSWQRHDIDLSFEGALSIAKLLANINRITIDERNPEMDCVLPSGERIAVVIPPFAETGVVVLSIRKQVVQKLSIAELGQTGYFRDTRIARRTDARPLSRNAAIEQAAQEGDGEALLRQCVLARRNIVVGGGTGAGKTTLLNALLKEVPRTHRIVTIEDVREVDVPFENAVSLVVPYSGHSVSTITAQDALRKAMRLKPDRVLFGECRGAETKAFLTMLNSGHPGSITSVHADDAATIFWKLAVLAAEASKNATLEGTMQMVLGFIDVAVFVQSIEGVGRRAVEIHYI